MHRSDTSETGGADPNKMKFVNSGSPTTAAPLRLCSIYARDVASLLERLELAGVRLASSHWAYGVVERLAAAGKLPRYLLELEIRKADVSNQSSVL